MNYEDLPADLRALDQQQQNMADITIVMYEEGTSPSKVTFDVPAASPLRGREWQSLAMIVIRLESRAATRRPTWPPSAG
ncbi:MAG: hypothetical protein ACRDTT_05380 [Pseudonocardiaceae bacterium]